jgi:hypothetical protein
MILDLYEPLPTWYLHNAYGIHGIGHAARVLAWAERIGQSMIEGGTPVDLPVIRWAAVLHDVRRVDESQDPLHGQRVAKWIHEYSEQIAGNLDAHQLQQVIYCCTWHVPDDHLAPKLIPELICLKDADGLDRVRLNDLNPAFLRTPSARDLCSQAQRLYDDSMRNDLGNSWALVREAALRLGIWR